MPKGRRRLTTTEASALGRCHVPGVRRSLLGHPIIAYAAFQRGIVEQRLVHTVNRVVRAEKRNKRRRMPCVTRRYSECANPNVYGSVCQNEHCAANHASSGRLKIGVANVGGPQIGVPRFARWVADLSHRESGCIWALSEMRPSQANRMTEYASIARFHGMHLFASPVPFGDGGAGLAVLVPVAWCDVNTTECRELIPGNLLRVTGLRTDTEPLTLLVVYGPNAVRERDDVLRDIVVRCVTEATGALVVAGDFNCVAQSCRWLAQLERDGLLLDTTAVLGATHSGGRAIDKIYVSGHTTRPPLGVRSWPTASDHLAVVADWGGDGDSGGGGGVIGHFNSPRWRRSGEVSKTVPAHVLQQAVLRPGF